DQRNGTSRGLRNWSVMLEGALAKTATENYVVAHPGWHALGWSTCCRAGHMAQRAAAAPRERRARPEASSGAGGCEVRAAAARPASALNSAECGRSSGRAGLHTGAGRTVRAEIPSRREEGQRSP